MDIAHLLMLSEETSLYVSWLEIHQAETNRVTNTQENVNNLNFDNLVLSVITRIVILATGASAVYPIYIFLLTFLHKVL